MSDRGEYRSIPRVLLDGPDFQQLPERARHTFLVLKLNFGPAGIDVWYPSELVARLSAQTGISQGGIQEALMTLEKAGWIQREANVVWIVGQLAHDPHVKIANPKHRKMVQTVAEGLPRLAIVGRFIRAYEHWFRDGGDLDGTPSRSLQRALDSLSDSLSRGYREGTDSLSNHKKEEDKEEEKDSLGSSGDDPIGNPGAAYPPEFEAVWTLYPKRTGGNSKRDAFKAWRARLRAGVTVEVLHAGVERYRAYCDREGKTGSQYVMQAQTFFGPGERYLEAWEAPSAVLPMPAPDRAEQAWDELLALLPAWNRREITAEIHAGLPEGMRRGLSKIGGFRVLAETPEKGRAWLRKDFVTAFNQTPIPQQAGAA